jgi:hypothetical protein
MFLSITGFNSRRTETDKNLEGGLMMISASMFLVFLAFEWSLLDNI